MPLNRYEPMRVVEQRESCRVNDIASDLAITVGAVSKLVDRIEAAGHCIRRRDPADARSSIIELTDDGLAVLERAHSVIDVELAKRLADPLTPQALRAFANSVTQLRQAAASVTMTATDAIARTPGARDGPRVAELR